MGPVVSSQVEVLVELEAPAPLEAKESPPKVDWPKLPSRSARPAPSDAETEVLYEASFDLEADESDETQQITRTFDANPVRLTGWEWLDEEDDDLADQTSTIVPPNQLQPPSPSTGHLDLRRGPPPLIVPGLPISAYSELEIDEVVAWIVSDGETRSEKELTEIVRQELGVARRNPRIDAIIEAALERRRSL